jgi:hypothetical protein
MAASMIQTGICTELHVLESQGIAILSLLGPNCEWELENCLSFIGAE